MIDIILILIITAIVVSISVYLLRAKKRGETCIGCPYAKSCGGKCGSSRPGFSADDVLPGH